MKRHKIFIALAFAFGALTLQSCLEYDTPGDEFNSTTTNVQKVTTRGKVDSIPYKSVYTGAQVAAAGRKLESALYTAIGAQFALRGGKNGENPGAHAYQYQYGLGADNYSQYGVVPHQNFIYSKALMSSSYNIVTKFYGGAMGSFKEVSVASTPLLNHATIDTIPELKAIYLLLYNYAALDVASVYGPFAYQDLKTNKQSAPYEYNDLRTIYTTIEANIDTIVACLKHFDTKPQDYQDSVKAVIQPNLLVVNERETGYTNLDTWVRFANSLKLRMAMHIVKVDEPLAKKWAEEAVQSGVIETEAQEVALRPLKLGFTNPILQISQWGDIRMSASMESLLSSLKHPYMDYLFSKNSQPITNAHVTPNVTLEANSRVVGIRSGTHTGDGQGYDGNQYIAFSQINSEVFHSAPLYLMKLSEVCFLRAEGAVRGWSMGGTAQHFYEQGILHGNCEDRNEKYQDPNNNNKNPYDDKIAAYMQLENPVPYTYVDPTGDTDPIQSVTTIGVKWNDSDTKEVMLEKIITQKYIAGYPESFQAWIDLRRTGYPKLFEVLNADECDGSLQQGDIIRRLPFADRENLSTQQDINATGLRALGGEDVAGTRLWWDVNRPNF